MSTAADPPRPAYAAAGVDVAAGDRAVDLLRRRLRGQGSDLLGGLAGFGAALELPPGMCRPVIVTATDGVGTKTELCRLLDRWDTIGRDLVAMCADDVVCHGARPAWFLDYVAVGRVAPDRIAEVVGGIADACAEVGAELVGGETAEHPGLMAEDQLDLAGFCVGLVEREQLLDGSEAQVGDVIVGLASSGLHANGYSLVRTLLADGSLALAEDLLEPTRLYAAEVLAVLDRSRAEGWRLAGVGHVTGGGLPGNLPRSVPAALGVEVEPRLWPVPAVIERVARAARLSGEEMRATFNGGIGMALIVEAAAAHRAIELLHERGVPAWAIGEVVQPGGSRYRERS
ncbi:MAG TPA: phosphoribosylformylglycinamidine cyclo-ligase [Candidatus Limnocylindrales bacterium]|nr:phosphoribosylformylglycinamidine cyclo-ligase [Candidatus Limnocylindrales bacterium]